MKKSFSKNLFIFTLRTSFLPFVIYSGISIALAFLMYGLRFEFYTVDIVDIDMLHPLLTLLSALMIPLVAKAFEFYTKRCDADFFEALPYTRRQVMLSTLAALSLLSLLAVTVSGFGCMIVSLRYIRENVFLFGDSILIMLKTWAASCITAVVTAIAVSLSGKLGNIILAAFIFLVVPSTVMDAFCSMVETSPLLVEAMPDGLADELPLAIAPLVYLAVAAALCILALYLFYRRKSEIATRYCASPLTGHILRIGFALPTSLLVTEMIYAADKESLPAIIIGGIFLFVITMLIYFGYELIAVKNKGAFLSALKGLPILVGINVLVAVAALITGGIMGSIVPTETSISYVSVVAPDEDEFIFYDDSLYTYVTARASDVRLDDPEAKAIIARVFAENDKAYRDGSYDKKYIYSTDVRYESVRVKIGLGLGSITRTLYLTEDEKLELDYMLAERAEYRQLWTDLPSEPYAVLHYNAMGYTTVDREDAELVYDALLRDLSKMTFEEWYAANMESADHELTVVAKNGNDAYKFSIPVTESTPEAMALLGEKLDEKCAENYEELVKHVDAAASGRSGPVEVSFGIYIGEDYYYDWFTVDNSEEGRRVAEFIKNSITVKYPDLDNGDYVDIGVYAETSFYEYYDFAYSGKYTVDELKLFFNEHTSKI